MLVNRTGFIVITFLIMMALAYFTQNIILAGGITFVSVMVGYIIIGTRRNKKRVNLLEESCDPQAFIDSIEKQREITGKNPKIGAYLDTDLAAAFILMGEFQKAKELLLSIDKAFLSEKNGTLLGYTINLISCYYELGEIDEAEAIFETEIPLLPSLNPRMILAMNVLVAERFFFLERYEESREKFQELLKEEISRRSKLAMVYRLAQIDEVTGEMDSARKGYQEVAEQGEKLWIASESQKQLKQIK